MFPPPVPSRSISIHALRGEGDEQKKRAEAVDMIFQSTPSVGRATKLDGKIARVEVISIHALRGEGDMSASLCNAGAVGISIHALRGEGDVPFPTCDA